MITLSKKELSRLRIISNKVLVSIEGKITDYIKIKKDDGGDVKLFLDTSYDPHWHVTVRGKVKSVCEKIVFDDIENDPNKSLDWGTSVELSVGDEVVFDYNAISKNFNVDGNNNIPLNEAIMCEDQLYLFVRYDFIFCKIVDGKEIPINGYVFATPVDINPIADKAEKLGLETSLIKNEDIHFKVEAMGKPNKGYRGATRKALEHYKLDSKQMKIQSDFGELKLGDIVRLENTAFAWKVENKIHQTLSKPYVAFQRRWISCVISIQ